MPGNAPPARATSCRAQAIVRMVVAAYFIAHALGFVFTPIGVHVMAPTGTASVAGWAATTVVLLMGLAMLMGRMVRPAALVLGAHAFWTGLLPNGGLLGGLLLDTVLWSEMTMLGLLALLALVAPKSPCSAQRALGSVRMSATGSDTVRPRLELAATRATLAEIQASEKVVAFAPQTQPLRRSA